MKKFARRSLAILLAVIMTASICCMAVPATTIAGDADYTLSGGFHTISFNPANGYIAVPYTADGVSRATVPNFRNYAAREYCGSTTVAAAPGFINGSYFDMTTGVLNGSNMTNGKIIVWSEPWQFQDSAGYYEPLILFKSDGSITSADSNMDIACTIGTGFSCNISYVNKYPDTIYADVLHYFDANNLNGTSVSGMTSGRFLIVEKDNEYVNLGIGVPVTGKVVRVDSGTGCTFEANQFALYFSGTGYFNNVAAGDVVTICANETRADAKAAMNDDIIGFMQCTGYLIKDGVDHTDLYSYIGPGPLNNSEEGHSVTLTRGWTGMGIKEDGSIVMMISYGQSTMSAMANQMLALGVVNAFRMDSGGSSQMRAGTSTYYSESARNISEGIVIANTSMMGNDAVKTELGNLIAKAEEVLGSDTTLEAVVEAKANYAGTIQADQRKSIGKLVQLLTSKGMLNALVDSAAGIDASTLSDYKADLIQTAALEGKRLVASSASTDEQCDAVSSVLSAAINSSFNANRISLGAAYKTSTVNTAYPDNGGAELTDGDLYEIPNGGYSDRWTGFQKANAAGSNSAGSYAEVYVDLGSAQTVTAASVTAENRSAWGISAPSKVEVLVSTDGKTFSKFLTLENSFDAASGGDQIMFYAGQKTTTARYFAFRAYFDSDHVFLGEVSLYGANDEIYAPVDIFNTSVSGTLTTTIFTTDFASSLTASNANLNWCNVAVCDYDEDLGAYVVTGFYQNRGSTTAVTVPSDGFVAAFYAEAGWALSDDIKVGDYAYINGTHLNTLSFDVCARIAFKAPTTVEIGDYEVVVGFIAGDNGIANSDDDFIRLFSGDVTVAQLLAVSSDKGLTVKVNGLTVTGNTKIGTGAVITDSNGESYTTYVFADVNGDSKTTAIDYLLLKRVYMGTYNVEGVLHRAACVSGNTTIRALDYLMLKRFLLGTYEPA